MDLRKLYLVNNNCYKTGKKQKVKGIMWHSTGVNNPFLSRYVGPDDGHLGYNRYNNHWNQPKPDGRSVCVHAFIGYLKDKKGIATYQTLPWDYVGWHSGSGPKGSANTQGYIGFEICESDLNDKDYFNLVYKEALELTVHLCRMFGLTEKNVIDHQEGHKMGIASNHGDVRHWFSRHGKTMDDVRRDVRALLNNSSTTPSTPTSTVTVLKQGSKGAAVKNLQSDLVKLGYNLTVDGSFGPATRQAILKFQGDHNLTRDGIVGPQTQNKIKELLAVKTSKPSSKGNTMYRVVVGSYTNKGAAEAQQRVLSTVGFTSFLATEKINGTLFYRVVNGSFADKSNAEAQQKALKAKGFNSFLVASNP